MNPAIILKLALVLSIVLFVLSIGLAAPPGSIRRGLREPGRIGRAMLSMFVAFPAFTLFIAWLLPLEPAARVALLAIAVSPMPPILPAKEEKPGDSLEFALAIQIAASVFALLVAPLFILLSNRVFGGRATLDIGGVEITILVTIVAPLVAGILFASIKPDLAARIALPLRKVATVLLVIGVLVVVIAAFPRVVAGARFSVVLAVALMTGFGLAVGHWLGGPDKSNAQSLAFATAARHPGVAIGLATAAPLVAQPPVVAVILLYLLGGALLSMPYARWAKARA
jgi:BASS family bile acid:Na+ symporter